MQDSRFAKVFSSLREAVHRHPRTSRLFDQTTDALEWQKLLGLLGGHARSSRGAALARAGILAPDLSQASRFQRLTTELANIHNGPDSIPLQAFPDVEASVRRASKGAVLEAYELRDHAMVLAVWDDVYRFLQRHSQDAPALVASASALSAANDLRPLKAALNASVQSDGAINESATPELRRLTAHANELKQHIRHRLEDILHSQRYEDLLQERYFAEREGRYVLPIKVDMQRRVPGIVHDVSASGATVFIEPRELVDLNNAIKVADREIDREVMRILRELSGRIAEQADVIVAGLNALAELDVVAARAAFGRQLQAHPVSLNDEGRIRLRQARHPLLVLSKPRVVANDLVLDDQIQVLVISGPNTGGKTVALKIVGLFALMARSGMHLPCEPESEMAVFSELFAHIGDAQDLARDLSSFSAHMMQMVELLRRRFPARQALVLLDEPVTSTDPVEGAALAEVLLCRLAELGMKVIATTHYRSLKILAQTRQGFANASVEFDLATLSPTYRLFMGIPGGSSAIEIAGRLGLEQALLDEARQKLKSEDRTFEQMLTDLHAKQRQLTMDLARAVEARAEAESAAARARAHPRRRGSRGRARRSGRAARTASGRGRTPRAARAR